MLTKGETGCAYMGNLYYLHNCSGNLQLFSSKKFIKESFFLLSKGTHSFWGTQQGSYWTSSFSCCPETLDSCARGQQMRNCHLGKESTTISKRKGISFLVLLFDDAWEFCAMVWTSCSLGSLLSLLPTSSRPRSKDTGPPARSQNPAEQASPTSYRLLCLGATTLSKTQSFKFIFSKNNVICVRYPQGTPRKLFNK